VELGQRSCVSGLGYEEASLAADAIYDAFARTGQAERFAVGKHTFVRYALERGGNDCLFRLSPASADGWIPVAGDGVVLAARDPDVYARWRLRQPPVPWSPLFPQPARPPLRAVPDAWPRTIALDRLPGSALVIEDFDPRDEVSPRARLLVPIRSRAADGVRLGLRIPHRAVRLEVRTNGVPTREIDVPADASTVDLPAGPWKAGWNVLEVRSRPAGVTLETIGTAAGDR
jgi:hypothetical protein